MKKQLEMIIAVTAKEREIEQEKKDYEDHKNAIIRQYTEKITEASGCSVSRIDDLLTSLIDEL